MRWFIKLLPIFIVVRLARKCEVVSFGNSDWFIAFDDVLVKNNKK